MIRTFFILLALIFTQASAPTTNLFLREITSETKLPNTGEFLFIDSPGGEIDAAFALVPQVNNRKCIVFRAASAALLIILPACKERYYVTNATFQFHSAVIMIPPFLTQGVVISQWDAADLANELAKANDKIIEHLIKYKVPFPELWLRTQMKENTTLTGKSLDYWQKWANPVIQCIDCPEWVKMIDMKNVLQKP